jgi:hypothetical protein
MRTLRQQMRWIMLSVAILFVLSIFGWYGFDGTRRRSGGENGIQDYAVAEVNGKKIMRSTLEESLRHYVERSNISDVGSDDMPRLRRDTLDGIVVQMQLEEEAKTQGVKPTEADIDKAVAKIADNFPTKEAFQQYLEQTGLRMADLRKNVSEQLSQQKLIETALATVKVTSDDVFSFYDKTRDLFFRQPAGVKLNFARFRSKDVAQRARTALLPSSAWNGVLASVASADVLEKNLYEAPVFIPDTGFVDKLASLASLDVEVPSLPVGLKDDDFLVLVKRENLSARLLPFEEASKDVIDLMRRQGQQNGKTESLLSQQRPGGTGAASDVSDEDIRAFYEKAKEIFFRKPAGAKLNFARFKSRETAEKVHDALLPSANWNRIMDSISSADLLEKSPSEAPIFVPDTGFVDKLASIASLDFDVPSGPIALASDDVILVLKRTKVDARVLSFDEVSRDVHDLVLRQNQQSAQTEYLRKLRSQAKVTILDASIFPAAEVSGDIDIKPGTASGDVSQDKK